MSEKQFKNWKAGEGYIIHFDDKSAEERTEKDLEKMVEEIREVANEYDFNPQCWGGEHCMILGFILDFLNTIKDIAFESIKSYMLKRRDEEESEE